LGALILLRISIGQFSSLSDAAVKLVKVRKVIYPNEKNVQIYDDAFKLFKEAVDHSLKIASKHSRFVKSIKKYYPDTLKNL
jgi:sugar (pentulose or hexulose) kinase